MLAAEELLIAPSEEPSQEVAEDIVQESSEEPSEEEPENELLYVPISKQAVEEKTAKALPNQVFVDIVADEVFYNQEQNHYDAKGNAETYLPGKNAKLFADYISYDSESELLEAFGNIKIIQAPETMSLTGLERDSKLPLGTNVIYGTYISFNTTSNEYELKEPKLYVNGLKLKARTAKSTYVAAQKKKKSENVLVFSDGVMATDHPITVYAHGNNIYTRYSAEQARFNAHKVYDWDDISDKQTLHYSAREIYYDNTSKTNNLRIKGARVWMNDKFSLPAPFDINTTVGEAADTKFKGPVIGTTERIGGFALGPRYFFDAEKGVFSLVPVVQLGNGHKVGAGLIGTFNTPGDKTAIMAGYGTLYNRPIASFHQEIFDKHLQANALVNQYKRDSIFGSSLVGQSYELSSDFKLKLPFMDERGMRIRAAAGWEKDNNELFSSQRREQLASQRPGDNLGEEHSGFKSEVETSFYTQPAIRRGNELYNFSLRAKAKGAARYYGTGDFMTIASFGPSIEARVDNLSFEVAYLFSSVTGQSPFLFDQFIDGSQSVVFDGDYRVNKWLSLGTLFTYNMTRQQFVRNEVRTEFGPHDMKLRLSYDTILNQVAIGFNAIYGEPVKYDKLKVKM